MHQNNFQILLHIFAIQWACVFPNKLSKNGAKYTRSTCFFYSIDGVTVAWNHVKYFWLEDNNRAVQVKDHISVSVLPSFLLEMNSLVELKTSLNTLTSCHVRKTDKVSTLILILWGFEASRGYYFCVLETGYGYKFTFRSSRWA